MFLGRNQELEALRNLKRKKTASLACVMGRRRIGKSALIGEFGRQFTSFIEIQGLGPNEGASNKDQLEHFSNKLSLRFNTRKEHFENWTEAFTTLAKLTQKGDHLILLDEISWMGKKDPLFTARLKDIWDTQLKKNPQLILVVCGSVSSWIEKNILRNANFEGRVSLEINLQELPLHEIHKFWERQGFRLSSREKMLLLSITGGVPKYLEEVLASQSISQNIIKLCFRSTGFLFNEYDKIFMEIFDRKGKTFEKMIKACLESKLSPTQLAGKLHTKPSSEFSEHIHILELSGFLSRDYYYHPSGEQSKLGHLRLKDNYLRFYLKYIQPLKDKIKTGAKVIESLSELKQFDSIMGLQFENLLLANRQILHRILAIQNSDIISSAPHVQKKKVKTKGACQIDLLIHTSLDVFYLCEFKCKKVIDRSVIKEVKNKMDVLSIPRRASLKPVLVYEGELPSAHQNEFENFFHRLIPFQQLIDS